MGQFVNNPLTNLTAWAGAALVLVLNLIVLFQAFHNYRFRWHNPSSSNRFDGPAGVQVQPESCCAWQRFGMK